MKNTNYKSVRLTREQLTDNNVLILINAINNQYKQDLKYTRGNTALYDKVLYSYDKKRYQLFKALEENIKR